MASELPYSFPSWWASSLVSSSLNPAMDQAALPRSFSSSSSSSSATPIYYKSFVIISSRSVVFSQQQCSCKQPWFFTMSVTLHDFSGLVCGECNGWGSGFCHHHNVVDSSVRTHCSFLLLPTAKIPVTEESGVARACLWWNHGFRHSASSRSGHLCNGYREFCPLSQCDSKPSSWIPKWRRAPSTLWRIVLFCILLLLLLNAEMLDPTPESLSTSSQMARQSRHSLASQCEETRGQSSACHSCSEEDEKVSILQSY